MTDVTPTPPAPKPTVQFSLAGLVRWLVSNPTLRSLAGWGAIGTGAAGSGSMPTSVRVALVIAGAIIHAVETIRLR